MADIIQWLADRIQWIIDSVWHSILGAVLSLLNNIPVPSFLQNLPTVTFPAQASYIMAPFHIDFGLAVVVGAIFTRFTLKRLPFIG